jgi:hypothetical protein
VSKQVSSGAKLVVVDITKHYPRQHWEGDRVSPAKPEVMCAASGHSSSAGDLARNYKGLSVLGRAAEVPERVYLHAIQHTRVGKKRRETHCSNQGGSEDQIRTMQRQECRAV